MFGIDKLKWTVAKRRAEKHRRGFRPYLREQSRLNRDVFVKGLLDQEPFPLELVSFSSERDFEDQALSILSFVKNCGMPRKWTVLSDGSHSDTTLETLRNLAPFITVQPWDAGIDRSTVHPALNHYAEQHALGKRLIAYSRRHLPGETLFLDSDILFYGRAREGLTAAIATREHWFLPDSGTGYLDPNYLRQVPPFPYGVNGGFLLLRPDFEWTAAVSYIESLSGKYTYFSEQTAVHIAALANRAMPFDPRYFVISGEDQFHLGHAFLESELAIRHYTAPTRHKMWSKAGLF